MSTCEVQIDGQNYTFGFIGRSFRLDCVPGIRKLQEGAFNHAVSKLPSDPMAIASQIGTAIDAYMSSVLVEDSDINTWLETPEGEFFAFTKSFRKQNPDATDEKIYELFDHLDSESSGKLRDFWGRSMNGLRYDDVIDRIEANITEQVRQHIYNYYKADRSQVESFIEFLKTTRTDVDIDGIENHPSLQAEEDAPTEAAAE